MKRWLFLLVLFTGCCRTHSFQTAIVPQLVSIHIIDRNGIAETIGNRERLKSYEKVDFLKNSPYKKVLRIYSRDAQGNSRAYITTYYENGQLQRYLEVVNGRAFGYYREWHDNGMVRLESHVVGGMGDISLAAENSWLFDDVAQAWDAQGNLLTCCHYSKGKLEGESLHYHGNGQLWKRASFVDGELEGIQETYYEEGTLLQKMGWKKGKKEGEVLRLWPGGSLAAREYYRRNLLLEGEYRTEEGTLVAKIEGGHGMRALFGKERVCELQEYHHGLQEGTVRRFGEEGQLLRQWQTVNGKKHGPAIDYWQGGGPPVPKLEVSWYEDRVQGQVKTWYPNGILESQKEMVGNMKNGLLTCWYRDGSLMLIEEYDKDKLIRGEYYRKGEKNSIGEVYDGEGSATLFDGEGTFLQRVHYKQGKPLLD